MIKVDKSNLLERKRVNIVYAPAPEETVLHLPRGTFACSKSYHTPPTWRSSRQCAFEKPHRVSW